ncbi:hypothetical protein AA0117_g11175 [Alternaria alternata]|uniref:Cytochrome b mRNA-processing protein 4 n=5 Tax=Alternaria sect. Alternaria TaxID=2499237 RepID=A0A4V1WQA1_ALTAL|nr:assembly factor cbp4 [Alternaria postmessia]KAI5375475.1 assembly factor cbp4 [Alternaria postmessia]RYN68292.1 hypothetical protein AA0117_g11175 [Alternaria alternata]
MALVWIVDFTTLAAQDSTNNPDTLIQRPQLQRELTRYLQRDSEHHQEVIMPSMSTYIKAISGGAILVIGGPALVWYVTPTEEEIFKRYSPELQKKALAGREQRQKDFDAFVGQLKEASRSDKPIWAAQKEMDAKRSEAEQQLRREERDAYAAESRRRQAEIRESAK